MDLSINKIKLQHILNLTFFKIPTISSQEFSYNNKQSKESDHQLVEVNTKNNIR